MEELTLLRLPGYTATPGVLMNDNGIMCWTLELPYKDNKPNISCIYDFKYLCKKVRNRKTLGGMNIDTTFEVTNVDNRSGILFHIGNQVGDTQGCILLGKGINLDRRITLAYSRVAFAEFIDYFADADEFILKITQYDPKSPPY